MESAEQIRQRLSAPDKSREKYEKAWERYCVWKKEQEKADDDNSEDTLLEYFNALSQRYAISSLWTFHSMLARRLKAHFFQESIQNSSDSRYKSEST